MFLLAEGILRVKTIFFLKLHFPIYKLSIQIQISLILGNLYLAGLHTDISIEQEKKIYN